MPETLPFRAEDLPPLQIYQPPDPDPDPPDLQALRAGLVWLILVGPCDAWPASAGRMATLELRAHYLLPLFVAGDRHLDEIEASRAGYLSGHGAGYEEAGALIEEQPDGRLRLLEVRQPCLGRRLAATLSRADLAGAGQRERRERTRRKAAARRRRGEAA